MRGVCFSYATRSSLVPEHNPATETGPYPVCTNALRSVKTWIHTLYEVSHGLSPALRGFLGLRLAGGLRAPARRALRGRGGLARPPAVHASVEKTGSVV